MRFKKYLVRIAGSKLPDNIDIFIMRPLHECDAVSFQLYFWPNLGIKRMDSSPKSGWNDIFLLKRDRSDLHPLLCTKRRQSLLQNALAHHFVHTLPQWRAVVN